MSKWPQRRLWRQVLLDVWGANQRRTTIVQAGRNFRFGSIATAAASQMAAQHRKADADPGGRAHSSAVLVQRNARAAATRLQPTCAFAIKAQITRAAARLSSDPTARFRAWWTASRPTRPVFSAPTVLTVTTSRLQHGLFLPYRSCLLGLGRLCLWLPGRRFRRRDGDTIEPPLPGHHLIEQVKFDLQRSRGDDPREMQYADLVERRDVAKLRR